MLKTSKELLEEMEENYKRIKGMDTTIHIPEENELNTREIIRRYKIIAPIKNHKDYIIKNERDIMGEVTKKLFYVKKTYMDDEVISIGDIGDIITFSQLEEFIKLGLHPIYFTEYIGTYN